MRNTETKNFTESPEVRASNETNRTAQDFESTALVIQQLRAAEAAGDIEAQAALVEIDDTLEILNYDLRDPKSVSSLFFSENKSLNDKVTWSNYKFMFDSNISSKGDLSDFSKKMNSPDNKGGNGLTYYGAFESLCKEGIMESVYNASREKNPTVPLTVGLIACVESYANPESGTSGAGAVGMWQITKLTKDQFYWAATGKQENGLSSGKTKDQFNSNGKYYPEDLKKWMEENQGKSSQTDLRKDPKISALAVVGYMRQMYTQIKGAMNNDNDTYLLKNKSESNLWSWTLAAYNLGLYGEKGILSVFKKCNGDLETAYKENLFPEETKQYLLKIFGLQRYIYNEFNTGMNL